MLQGSIVPTMFACLESFDSERDVGVVPGDHDAKIDFGISQHLI